MVLPCAEGVTHERVAADLGVDQSMVDRWRARLVADRLDGLDDEPRTGQVAHPRSCSTRSKASSSRPWNPHRARTLIGEPHRCHRAVEFKKFLTATDSHSDTRVSGGRDPITD
ncbi:helix-turn-helix domain-containing protein [Streptomyces sp. NPDC096311]|uniref:helix-turn-helix domain-containing protein n=1 Tax=Streptomyces sp. NPDC096311 TaxID=3366083 RepID=UPI00381D605D